MIKNKYVYILAIFVVAILFEACSNGETLTPEPTFSITEPTDPSGDPTLSPLSLLPEHTLVIPTNRPKAILTPGSAIYINVVDDAFIKHTVTIPVGTTIIWNHVGISGEAHSVTSEDDIFASAILLSGNSFTFTFKNSGTYPYFCIPHRGDMEGLIIVTEE